jgi:GMP reductase
MRIEQDIKLDFKDVLLRPKRSTLSSRSQVSLERTFTFRNARAADGSPVTWTGVPIIVANMETCGTIETARVTASQHAVTALHKHYAEDVLIALGSAADAATLLPYVALSMGSSKADFEKMERVMDKLPLVPFICLDVANGYSEHFVDAVRRVRARWPDKILLAGNVATGEMAEELILQGCDIAKIGIGSGSVCVTRSVAGVGMPQLSAIIECADAAHGLGGAICGDGGLTTPGDFAKGFAAGADFLMAGGYFAGHDESDGEEVTINGKKFKEFYGMSSSRAMAKHHGGVAEYRSSEGKVVRLPYRGPLVNTLNHLFGGLNSALTYTGAAKLKELSKRATFVRVTQTLNPVYNSFAEHAGEPGAHDPERTASKKRTRSDA